MEDAPLISLIVHKGLALTTLLEKLLHSGDLETAKIWNAKIWKHVSSSHKITFDMEEPCGIILTP